MVYVDEIFTMDPMLFASRNPAARQASSHGRQWCHLWAAAEKDIEELHRIARKIGLKRIYFQERPGFPHYDLIPRKREMALAAGAVAKPLKEWIKEKANLQQPDPGLAPTSNSEHRTAEQATLL